MYRISITKTVAGESESMPLVTVESKKAARRKMDEYTDFYTNVLNAENMRMVGAEIEVICEECEGITGLGDCLGVVEYVKIKRPMNSQRAEIHRLNDPLLTPPINP